MATLTPTVFLSSTFAEFHSLRQRVGELLCSDRGLPCRVVDLSKNFPDTNPPLTLCLNHARTADVMVLFVGESYGTIPPGQTRSYTELEWEAACGKESNAVVLPYFFEEETESSGTNGDQAHREWKKRILESHTVSRYRRDRQSAAAVEIFQDVVRNLIAISAAERQVDADLWMIPDSEVGEMDGEGEGEPDRRIAEDARLKLETPAMTNTDLLASPARAAAAEQKREALRAMALGERWLAVWHLNQAVERHPWDLAALYWTARLLLLSGQRDAARGALRTIARAAHIAEKEPAPSPDIPRAACHMLAARAAGQLGDHPSAVEFAVRAHDVAGVYWLTHFELARQYALAGDIKSAMKWARRAFFLRPDSIFAVHGDPAFRPYQTAYVEFRTSIKAEVRQEVGRILEAEQKLWTRMEALAGTAVVGWSQLDADATAEGLRLCAAELAALDARTILSLVARAQSSFTRQYQALRILARQISAIWNRFPEARSEREHVDAEFATGLEGVARAEAAVRSGETPVSFEPDRDTFRSSVGAAGLVTLLAIAVALNGHLWIGAVVVLLGVAGAAVGVSVALQRGHADAMRHTMEGFAAKRAEWEAWKAKRYEECDEHVRWLARLLNGTVSAFTSGVQRLERHALRKRIYCATAAMDAARPGDLVRLSPERHADRYQFLDALLPEYLENLYPADSAGSATHRLYKLQPGAPPVASRRFCYFEH
jgi:tetratricopeptide (TPR) repeat protein